MTSLPSRTNALVPVFLASIVVLALANPALAQEAAAAAAPVVHEKTLFQKIMVAGPVFIGMLFIASMCMFWLVIDGFLKTARSKLVPPSVVTTVRQHLVEGDYESAAHAVNTSETIFGEVAAAAFTKIGLGKDATDDAIYEELERTRAVFISRISYLSVIGVITPMIGLTGTVFGMIHAFDTLGSSGVGDPAKLSEAIGEVLVCTGGGLVVAIPAFAFYYVLRNRIAAGFRHVQTEVNAIFHHLPTDPLAGHRLEADAFIPSPPRAAAPVETTETTSA